VGGFTYQGDQGARELALGPGFEIAVGDPGSAVFEAIREGNGTFRVTDAPGNAGDAVADAGTVVDPAAFVPDTYTITFPTPDTFQVEDGSAAVIASGAFTSGDTLTFAGVALTIDGAPAAGDAFTVTPSATQDVFTTLDALVGTMRSTTANGADRAALHNAMNRGLADVDQALEHLGSVRASIGARLNAAENEARVAEDFGLGLEAAISAIEDVDVAEAASRLAEESASLQAAQRSFVLVQGLRLFDFL
jgi:flagellar hook-associated protein 3 FlgL